MAVFPSQAWLDVLKETLNTSPDWAKDAQDYVGTSIWVITPDGSLTRPVRLYMAYEPSGLAKAYVMAEGETREAQNTNTASLGTWRQMIEGKLNPAPAIMRGELKVDGPFMNAIRDIRAIQALFEHAWRIPSEFPHLDGIRT